MGQTDNFGEFIFKGGGGPLKERLEKEIKTRFQKSLKGGIPSLDLQEYCLINNSHITI
jgi:hypothetical protein